MTGFGGHGQDSFKGNRKLLGKRGMMKDNPYSPLNKANRQENKHVQELITWKNLKAKSEERLQIVIWILIGIIFLVSVFAFYFLD